MYSRETINELNQLSKEVFGSTSRWRKLVEEGEQRLVTEQITQFDPEANNGEGEEKKVTIASLHHSTNGGKLYKHYLHRYTTETVKELMIAVKAKREEFMVQLKQQQIDQQAAKEATAEAAFNAATVVDSASGSALI
jgi:hypothetical protein